MAPKSNIVYSRGRSKSVAPSRQMIGTSDDEWDPEYVPPGTETTAPTARSTQGTPKKVASSVVTASKTHKERTLTGAQFGSASGFGGVSGF